MKQTQAHVTLRASVLTVAALLFTQAMPAAGAAQLGGQPVLLKDLRAGPIGSSILGLTDVNGTLFFSADDGIHGRELWISDGTTAGTVMVADLAPGPTSGVPGVPDGFLATDNGLYFPALGNQLWFSDGTPAGTWLVRDFVVAAAPPEPWELINGELYFAADDGIAGRELWKTDGTVFGTTLLKDIRPGRVGSIGSTQGRAHAKHWGRLFFVADDGNGAELWQSLGTPELTLLVTTTNAAGPSAPDWLVGDGTRLWWAAETTSSGRELFYIDSTGPFLVEVDQFGGSDPINLTSWNGDLYFAASDVNQGLMPYMCPGGSQSPVQLAQIGPPFKNSITANVRDPFVAAGGELFFCANDDTVGVELWKTDGTPQGTAQVRDIMTGAAGSNPTFMTDLEGELFLTASSPGARELWRSDGTTAGTLPFFPIFPGGAADPDQITLSGGTVFMVANDGVSGRELWAFDRDLSGVTYCTPGTSAAGCTAQISASGIASSAEDQGFVVSVSGLPKSKDGILFYGSNGRQANSWGNGTSFQCVTPPVRRTPIQTSSGGGGSCGASMQLDLNSFFAAVPAKQPAIGAQVRMQCWYRDAQNTSNQTTSMSDALEFTFCP